MHMPELPKRRGQEYFTLAQKMIQILWQLCHIVQKEGDQKGGLDHYTSDVSSILGLLAPGSYRSALGKCSPSIYRQTHTEGCYKTGVLPAGS